MVWKAFEKLKERITGKPAETSPAAHGPPVEAPPKPGKDDLAQVPDLKELEKKGMLGQFFRHWKNPAFLRQVQAIAGRMKADGVDMKDAKAVQAWIVAHQKDLQTGGTGPAAEAPQKPETFVKSGPEVGRNDPCPCGSGKKHKKCCGK